MHDYCEHAMDLARSLLIARASGFRADCEILEDMIIVLADRVMRR